MNEWIVDKFKDNDAVKAFEEKKILATPSLIEEAIVIASSFKKNKRPIIIVKNNNYNAQRLYERITSLVSDEECVFFNVDESLRVEAIAASPEVLASRVEALFDLTNDDKKIVIVSAASLVRQLPTKEKFLDHCLHIKKNMEMNLNEMKQLLIEGGYSQVSHIDQPLSFAVRGGIVDIYSINYDQPIRVEFFDTEIDSIRFFDITTQKTIQQIEEAQIVPATDILFSDDDIAVIKKRATALAKEKNDEQLIEVVNMDIDYLENHIRENRLYSYMSFVDNTASIIDYLDNPLIILSNEDSINEKYKSLIEETTAYVQEMTQEHKMLPKYALMHDLSRVLNKRQIIKADPYGENISGITEVHLPKENLATQIEIIKAQAKDKTIVFYLSEHELELVVNACIEQEMPYNLVTDNNLKQGINIVFSDLVQGFEALNEHLLIITSHELFEVKTKLSKYGNKFKNAEVINSYQDLQPYDYVVHNQHGVGQYIGIETRVLNGIHRDYLKIIYKGNAELLVPLEQFRLVRKFVSREGIVPKLNKLGSDEWTKTKERLKENVNNIAERLVKLYAQREEHIGYAYKPDTEYQKEFENTFEYELTPDQKIAVEEVKEDMQKDKPMDRLLCGDVGFGKTEVAIRAAFKAIQEDKQVAFLCPTTILAEQHYKTFCQRFANFPANIKLLNRFVTGKQETITVKGVKEGTVDILIGTHRILSKDIRFKDLGLLIIDEEQRFGVEHKEKIKELKNTVDVLSLSATPIPRTLQMSLVGIRQLSQLETPPANRYSVQTYVVEKNDGLIKDTIERELSRDGQVFYLHNNVDEIYNTARRLQALVPSARIKVAHGQMNKDDIEEVMLQFNAHDIDVLVCTTIIETGLDIPNANTIIIDNAQNFGLSQLYQIKGRVGRSNRVAYAYLMIPSKRQVSEIAGKRLQAIKEFAQLGSGYKIAMRDLTIRGAGDLLGPDQSGFIDTVGIDMYIEMLEEAINEQKGIIKKEKLENFPIANISIDGYIPENFAPDDYDKISMYQKIDAIDNLEDLQVFRLEVQDEYGRLPKNVNLLFEKKRLEVLLKDPYIEKYRTVKGQDEIVFSKSFSDVVDGVKLFEIFTTISKDVTIKYVNGRIIVILPKANDTVMLASELIQRSKEAIKSEN